MTYHGRMSHMGPYGLYGPMDHMGPYGPSWAVRALMTHHGPMGHMGPYGLYGPMDHMGSYGPSWVAQALMSHHGPSYLREFVLVTLPSSFPCARLGARNGSPRTRTRPDLPAAIGRGTLDLPLITIIYDHIFSWKQYRFTNLPLQKKGIWAQVWVHPNHAGKRVSEN